MFDTMKKTLPKRIGYPLLALGGDLKCQPALAHNEQVEMLELIGDLAFPEAQDALEKVMDRYHPSVLVCDKHPAYFSANMARRLAQEKGIRLFEVQHHEAHVAAVCMEHGLFYESIVGLAFDGTGYGDDGSAWGGEFFVGSPSSGFKRKAHFAPVPVPGGDAAVRKPWRMALALMLERNLERETMMAWLKRCRLPLTDFDRFQKAFRSGFLGGRSTSLGRWFDVVSALLGMGLECAFEAQGAIQLQQAAESMKSQDVQTVCPVAVSESELRVIDYPDLALFAQTESWDSPSMAYAFHVATAQAVADVAKELAEKAGVVDVVASGGCFLNTLFSGLLEERIRQHGLRLILPSALPPGDQAIALGQIALALNELDGEVASKEGKRRCA